MGDGPRIDRRRAALGWVLILAVFLAAVVAIWLDRHAFVDTLREMGAGASAAALFFAVVGVAMSFPVWRAVLHGLGADLSFRSEVRVFFVSQLGKYLPGSVWPLVLQLEAARAKGLPRRTMLSANLLALVLTCGVGVVVACALLPTYRPSAMREYWWVLFALPFLVGLLHPRAMPAILDRVFVTFGHAALGDRLEGSAMMSAVGWALMGWLAMGAHIAVLCHTLGESGPEVFLLSLGGMALAVSLGVLFVPVPAGAGVREVVLMLVLVPVLDSGEALAVAVASRVLIMIADLLLAALAHLVEFRPRQAN